jgi:hypothetical protein
MLWPQFHPHQAHDPSSPPPPPRALSWMGQPSSEVAGAGGPTPIGEHQSEPKWRSDNTPEHRVAREQIKCRCRGKLFICHYNLTRAAA